MVFSICGVTSIDMVARSRWSRSTSAQNASLSPGPVTWLSWRRFFTQCARCHCADSHSACVTSAQPGNRRQSGSASSLRCVRIRLVDHCASSAMSAVRPHDNLSQLSAHRERSSGKYSN